MFFLILIFQLIPCIFFPICTVLLLKELLKTEKSRAKMLNSGHSENSSGRKTKLVLYLTITFFIADFPLGIVIFLKLFFYPSSAITWVKEAYSESALIQRCPEKSSTSSHSYSLFVLLWTLLHTCLSVFICQVNIDKQQSWFCAVVVHQRFVTVNRKKFQRLMIPETECSHKCGTDNK